MIRICVDCGRQFEITPGEENFYKSKGLDLPKRCKFCRDKKSGKNIVHISSFHPLRLCFAVVLFAAAVVMFFMDEFDFSIYFSMFSFVISVLLFAFTITLKQVDFSFNNQYNYGFYNADNLYKHFKKHCGELNCSSPQEYLKKANDVISNRLALKKRTVDGDTAYYITQTGEFVVVSPHNYIRTYYKTTYNYFIKQ